MHTLDEYSLALFHVCYGKVSGTSSLLGTDSLEQFIVEDLPSALSNDLDCLDHSTSFPLLRPASERVCETKRALSQSSLHVLALLVDH